METKLMEKVTLYSTEGGSDKTYTLWLDGNAQGLWTVQAQWGARGGSVQSGSKTPAAVSYDEARKVYDKVLKEKKAKGYHEGVDAPSFTQVAGASVDSGLRPMLLTDCSSEGPERFIDSDNWGAQEKMNGKRIMIRVTDKVVGVNRRGLECPIPGGVADALSDRWGLVLDGEMIGEVYHAFDLLQHGLRGQPVDYSQQTTLGRHVLMGSLLLNVAGNVRSVPLIRGREEKKRLVENLRAGRREGVVFKKLDAPYTPGRIENLFKAIAIKCKFYAEGLFQIHHMNTDRQSIEVAAWDEGCGVWAPVGNVTVPTKYLKQMAQGRMVRVRYLYATPAGRQLYQPNLDPTADGIVCGDDVTAASATRLEDLKYEGKEE